MPFSLFSQGIGAPSLARLPRRSLIAGISIAGSLNSLAGVTFPFASVFSAILRVIPLISSAPFSFTESESTKPATIPKIFL